MRVIKNRLNSWKRLVKGFSKKKLNFIICKRHALDYMLKKKKMEINQKSLRNIIDCILKFKSRIINASLTSRNPQN